MTFQFLKCSDGTVRVFKAEWASDMFEVYTTVEFEMLKRLARRIGIMFNEQPE